MRLRNQFTAGSCSCHGVVPLFVVLWHDLRDGAQLPRNPAFESLNRCAAAEQLKWWKTAAPRQILGDMRPATPPPFTEYTSSAERIRAKQEWLKRE
jgi:hypothetical protein